MLCLILSNFGVHIGGRESGEGHRRNQELPRRSEMRVGARFVSSGGILRGWTRLCWRIHCAKQQTGRGRNVMKFGIFYELQLPRPWQAGGELKLYQDALTQLETADRCGYDHAWVVEHHFLEEYSHSPSPESFLAAASQRT